MDDPHQEESTTYQSAARQPDKIADELSPPTSHGADAARADADLVTSQAETLSQIWLSGGELASHLVARCADRFSRALGIRSEQSEEAGQQVSGSIGAMMQSGSSVARCAQAISTEWVELVLQRTERSLDHLDALMRSRTAQDFAAAQSEALRDQAEGVIERARRIAEITLRTADQLSRRVEASVGRMRRAA